MIYFLRKVGTEQYKEVAKETYVAAERVDGFYNTLGYPNEPATSAFKGMNFEGYTEFESMADFNAPRREIRHGVDEWGK